MHIYCIEHLVMGAKFAELIGLELIEVAEQNAAA
jgi:hypothetical protein